MKLNLLRDAIEHDPHSAASYASQPDDFGIDLPRQHGDAVRLQTSGSDVSASEYLLVCEARSTNLIDGYWRFSLESACGETVLEAEDSEVGDLNRLTLLAAIRGLEAIDGPASVTLLSNNRYLIRSLSDSLPRWRENAFAWEHFGRRVEVQHADLWRRIDRALAIHRVEACLVSSRLVSRGTLDSGQHQPSRDESIEAHEGVVTLRADAPHASTVRTPHVSRETDARPKDRLRRWLLGGGDAKAEVLQRRFTYHDLVDSHA